MIDYVIPPPPQPSRPVDARPARFPVRRVFCIGRNYAAHAQAMGHDPEREAPFFYTKPADAIVDADGVIPYPPLTNDLHHEIELVFALGIRARPSSQPSAYRQFWSVAPVCCSSLRCGRFYRCAARRRRAHVHDDRTADIHRA
ncbi:hypothetical protein CH289_03955 [Rhodococcus sp. RS1C4]|nr:fumarylacetoacetate hydrolase family protein [Rhodococcus sp. RS1C4]OZC57060.1 hypothetical protein CH289_03955 [Rhodococcus sp. RS1C4]